MTENFKSVRTTDTVHVSVWMAGDVDIARQAVREFCLDEGLCVTVTPTAYVYTGGEEAGFVLGLVNYPRFPTDATNLIHLARCLARHVAEACCQMSYLVEGPNRTEWYSRRKEN